LKAVTRLSSGGSHSATRRVALPIAVRARPSSPAAMPALASARSSASAWRASAAFAGPSNAASLEATRRMRTASANAALIRPHQV
jgi:hypothetical protein